MEVEVPQDSGAAPLTLAEIWKILRMQWHIAAAIAVLSIIAGIVVNVVTVRMYVAQAVIHISPLIGQEVELEEVVDANNLAAQRTYFKTQLDLLRSRDLRNDVIRRYEALGFSDLTVENGGVDVLDRALGVSQRRDSEIIDIWVQDTDPERAARLANLVTTVYREQTLDSRRDSARDAKEWLERQLGEYRERIGEQSRALVEYQRTHDLADVDQSDTSQKATMSVLTSRLADVSTQRVLLQTSIDDHRRLFAAGEIEALAKDMGSLLMGALTDAYASAATENAEIRARYLEKMPERIRSDAKLIGIGQELRKEVERHLRSEEAQLEMLRAREATLMRELEAAKGSLLTRQSNLVEYQRLKLDLQRTEELYAALSRRDGELDLVAQTHLSNVRVVDEARPAHAPVTPNIPRNMLIAVVAGVLLGCAVALLVEYLDDTISSPFDVTTYLRVPFLGIVPRLEGVDDDRSRALYTFRERNSSPAEALRAVRTLLDLTQAERVVRRILVTSSYTSEGKTTTVVGLAIAFANMGRRVLLIDADLRRPRLHYVFDVERTHGLSTVLTGGTIDEAVVKTLVPNLTLLPAGPRSELPHELLGSVAMGALLEQLDGAYDIVLIDSPPAGILSDAAILSKFADGVVFVVREKTVSRWMVRDVVHRLQQVGAPIVGAVVNNVDLTGRNSKYKYYYNYRYRYHLDETPTAAAK